MISPELTAVVQQVVEGYARPTIEGKSYAFSNTERQIFTVVIVPDYPPKFDSGIMVMARIVGNYVVIDEDTTDRPLWEELVRAGIPRDQIILTYAGEKLPQAS
ncbi:MAG: element excision factor XisI family protein [Chloroflexota bacterium]